jgi:hypothetical protein
MFMRQALNNDHWHIPVVVVGGRRRRTLETSDRSMVAATAEKILARFDSGMGHIKVESELKLKIQQSFGKCVASTSRQFYTEIHRVNCMETADETISTVQRLTT